MKILVCNDDGIFAEGILHLALSMSRLGEVIVVAPDSERSGAGHAITLHRPLGVKEVKLPGLDVRAYSVDGTPADCVKFAVDVVMEDKPDLVFSGINHGANLGTDVLYSGTVSAAIEGCILGFKSAAISLAPGDDGDFSYAGQVAFEIAKKMIASKIPPGTLLNINVPGVAKKLIRGIKVTRLGIRKYRDSYIKCESPRGKVYYWLDGGAVEGKAQEGTDIEAINNNYISVTPIHFDLTNYEYIDNVRNWF